MVSTGGSKQTALMLMPCARLRRPCPLQDAQPARQRRARYSNRCNVPLTEKKKKKKYCRLFTRTLHRLHAFFSYTVVFSASGNEEKLD